MISLIGIFIAGIISAYLTLVNAFTENYKLNIKSLQNSIYIDIAFCFVIYTFTSISAASIVLNIITIKFLILSLVDYEMLAE